MNHMQKNKNNMLMQNGITKPWAKYNFLSAKTHFFLLLNIAVELFINAATQLGSVELTSFWSLVL